MIVTLSTVSQIEYLRIFDTFKSENTKNTAEA